MEKLILGTRRSGKTQNLIERCSRDRYSIIVCPTREMCKITFDMAQDMGKPIPMPITFEEFISRRFFERHIEKFYIDELQLCLDTIPCHVPIEAAVIDNTYLTIEDINEPVLDTCYYMDKLDRRIQVDYDAEDTARVSKNVLEKLLLAAGFERR